MKKIKFLTKKYWTKEKIFDSLFLCILVILYSILATVHLGDDIAPQTFYRASAGENFYIKLPKEQKVSRMMIYTGETRQDFEGGYRIKSSATDGKFGNKNEVFFDGAFKWTRIVIGKDVSEIAIQSTSTREISFGEVALFDEDDNLIDISAAKVEGAYAKEDDGGLVRIKELVDESYTAPKDTTEMNTTYFDEVYFAQTAYEYANGFEGYETVHPPLGKIMQSIPIALTGRMTPFTWRIGGTICGIIIIIVTYFLAKRIFKKASYARVAAILISLSGLHFVQTRIGTIDSYLCLFTILSYLFMFKFVDDGKFKDFMLSGVFFGCAFATKWSGAFGGFGLAILFFRYLQKKKFKNLCEKNFIKWILRGCLCFILIPAAIYCGSYLLFPNTTKAHDLNDVFEQSLSLFRYHASENTPHPYSSNWYTWPIALKPIFYDYNSNDKTEIYLIANYVIAYVSVIALLASIYVGIAKKDRMSTYIVLAFLSLWLPYAFVSRPMFLYHYLPASVFAVLAIVNLFYQLPGIRKILPFYLAAAVISFIICYPKMVGI